MLTFRKLGTIAAILACFALTVEAQAGLFCKKCTPPPQKIVLHVIHPCTGCNIDIPACVPACCCEPPCISHHKTLFGAGKTIFKWKCGHKVVVRFSKKGGYHVCKW